MNHAFEPFEQGIERVAGKLPGMPQEAVVLTRLLLFTFSCVNDDLNRFLADHGLNTTSALALAMIYGSADNRVNPCELSRTLNSSRTNVTRLTDELERQGWVERNISNEDRRRIDLSLTAAGTDLVRRFLPLQWAHVQSLWEGFEAEERAALERLLRKMLTRLDTLQAADHQSPTC